jgi:hypothetical protein
MNEAVLKSCVPFAHVLKIESNCTSLYNFPIHEELIKLRAPLFFMTHDMKGRKPIFSGTLLFQKLSMTRFPSCWNISTLILSQKQVIRFTN